MTDMEKAFGADGLPGMPAYALIAAQAWALSQLIS